MQSLPPPGIELDGREGDLSQRASLQNTHRVQSHKKEAVPEPTAEPQTGHPEGG